MTAVLRAVLGHPTCQIPCRLCLRSQSDKEAWSHLDRTVHFASLRTTITLRAIINTVRQTQLYNDVGLPQNVCEKCSDEAIHSFLFVKKCEVSEKRWETVVGHLYSGSLSPNTNLKDIADAEPVGKSVFVMMGNECKRLTLPKNIYARDMSVMACKYICESFLNKGRIEDREFDVSDGHNSDCKSPLNKPDGKIKEYKTRRNKSTPKNNYYCSHCSVTFLKKQYLFSHLKSKHNVLQKVECNMCNRYFNSIFLLQKHARKHKTLNVYKCSLCLEVFNLASHLQDHMKVKHYEKKVPCPKCPELFYSISEAKEHQINLHDSRNNGICKICGKKYQSLARLRNHEMKHKDLICDSCGCKFLFPYKLKLHSEKCTAKSIKYQERRENHLLSDESVVEHGCEICKRKFSSAARLKCHVSRHTGVVCERCGRNFKYQSQLKAHANMCQKDRKPGNPRLVRVPARSPQLICDYCGKHFYLKESLRAHIKSQHLFHNIYKCDLCERRFSYKSGLKSHLVVHTRKRSEQCDTCGKYFVTKPALVYHMRLHTGERPFACDMCDEKFISASRKMAHVRTKHWGRTEECSVCSSKFYTPYALRKHTSRHFNPNSKLFCNKNINDTS